MQSTISWSDRTRPIQSETVTIVYINKVLEMGGGGSYKFKESIFISQKKLYKL